MFKNKIFFISTLLIVFSTISIGFLSYKILPNKKSFLELTMLQTNYKLLDEVLTKIEDKIVKNDQILYKFTRINGLNSLYKLIRRMEFSNIKGIFVMNINRDILFEKKLSGSSFLTDYIKDLLVRKKIPLDTVFHLHVNDGKGYRFFSSMKFKLKNKIYLIVLEYNIEFYKKFLKGIFRKFEQNYFICIRDYENNIILGTPFKVSKKFFVEKRFPNTFYKWIIQMAPKNYKELEREERSKKLFNFFSISINLTLILLAWALVFYNRKQEQKLAMEQEQFFWHISHELKTPISLIKMYCEMLEMNISSDPEKLKEYLKIIRLEAEKTTLLVNNVLDFSNIKKNQNKFYFEEVNLWEFLREITESYKFSFEMEGVKFSMEKEGDISEVYIDKNIFSLAVMNLLDNSIKYNDKEKKEISIKCGQRGDFVFFEVKDNGIGIEKRELKKIFDKFYRGSNIWVKKIRGSGIGLSLVKYIVEVHKGKIEVNSSPGEGTIFRIFLPVNFFEV